MRSSPPVRLPRAIAHSHLGELWLPRNTFYWDKHLHRLHSFCPQGLPLQKISHLQLFLPMPTPKQSPRLKRWHPLPESMGNMPMGRATPAAMLGGPPNPKKQENPPWFKLLKPRDSDIVVEARLCFFSKHSYNFNQDGNHGLSRIFKKLAVSASLLGTNISEIVASWTGPMELKQANYTLQSLPKGLKFLRVVSSLESPKVMGLVGTMTQMPSGIMLASLTAPSVGKKAKMKGQWSIT